MKKIVIVDDNKLCLEIVKDLLEREDGFKCFDFSNPEDALRYVLEEEEIYAVVSDYEMPQMNGLTLAKQILEKFSTIRIVVMSGHDTNYLRMQALSAEIDANKVKLLSKIDLGNLVNLLNN